MAYAALTCPTCGAAITTVPDRGSFFCQYCGAKIVKDKKFIEISGNITVGGMASVTSLLDRGFLFLEDKDFIKASEYFERVLDIDPKCSKAYLGKLMATERAVNADLLASTYRGNLEKNECFKKALRFADDEEFDELTSLKLKNLNAYNYRLKESNDTVANAEMTLASYRQYYAKHKYTDSRYIAETVLFALTTTVVSIITVIPVVALFMEGPIALIVLIPFVGMIIGLVYWGKHMKKKRKRGELLELDGVRLNNELEQKKCIRQKVIEDFQR